MALEFLGQLWNADTRMMHLLGKGDGKIFDLTPHLPYPSVRSQLRGRMAAAAAGALMLESIAFPTVQAVMEAEKRGVSLPDLLAPVWEQAADGGAGGGAELSEAALSVEPDGVVSHLAPCIIPLRAQAFGVTYENSALEREAEGDKEDYRYIYLSGSKRQERCEVFIKGTRPNHFFGPHGSMGLRSDLTNSVDIKGRPKPRETVLAGIEPELAAVTYSNGRILGYTLANDVSGNMIENESILYLFQAKYFVSCLGIGPWLLLSDEQANPAIEFGVEIRDENGRKVFEGDTDSRLINMPIEKLVAQAASHNPLYPGELFSTGTNMVPGDEAKVIRPGWRVELRSERLGTFTHGARLVSAEDPGNLDYNALEYEALEYETIE